MRTKVLKEEIFEKIEKDEEFKALLFSKDIINLDIIDEFIKKNKIKEKLRINNFSFISDYFVRNDSISYDEFVKNKELADDNQLHAIFLTYRRKKADWENDND